MAVVYKTSVSHLKVTNTLLRTTWEGKVQKNAKFPFSGQERAFLYKIVHRGIRNSRNFHHGKRNRQRNQVAKFFNNFQVHFVLYNQLP